MWKWSGGTRFVLELRFVLWCISNKSVWVPVWGGEADQQRCSCSITLEEDLAAGYVQIFSSLSISAQFVRLDGGRTRAQAAAPATKMIKCLIDPPREILGWIIGSRRLCGRETSAANTLFVAKLSFVHVLAASLRIFFLTTMRKFLNISLSTSPHSSPPKPAPELPVAHLHAAVGGCSQRDTDSGGGVKNGGC